MKGLMEISKEFWDLHKACDRISKVSFKSNKWAIRKYKWIVSAYQTAIERCIRSLKKYKGFQSMKRFDDFKEDFQDLKKGFQAKGYAKRL